MLEGEGCSNTKKVYSNWKYQTYMGANLDYDMLCEPKSSDNEKKEVDNLRGNHLVNPIVLTTNIKTFLAFL